MTNRQLNKELHQMFSNGQIKQMKQARHNLANASKRLGAKRRNQIFNKSYDKSLDYFNDFKV